MPVANKKFMKDRNLLYSGIAMFTFSAMVLFGQGTANASQDLNNDTQSVNSANIADTGTDAASTSTSLSKTDTSATSTVSASVQPANQASTTSSASAVSTLSQATTKVSDETVVSATSATSATTLTTNSSVTEIRLVNPTSDEITQAKSAAAATYAATGQAQKIVLVDSGSTSTTAAFLASIKQGALQGWVQYGVLPSVTAAQAILESATGTSGLATKGNNLFGIKGSYNGQSITMKTSEWSGSGYYTVYAAFRKYASFSESVLDHGRFLYTNSRYSNIIHNRSYTSVANDLHADGYATDPSYASKLINLIKTYGLASWDTEAFALTDKVSAGNLDNVSVNGSTLNINGWFAATDAAGKSNTYVIILDKSTGKEISRYKVSLGTRSDVQKAYSNVANSAKSGFSISVPYTSQFAGKNLTIIFRYSASTDGNSNYIDRTFSTSLTQNIGNIDSTTVTNDNKLNVTGWHASDTSLGRSYHYVILWDKTTGKELDRVLTTTLTRNDVNSAYSYVYNAAKSGFNVTFPYSVSVGNDVLQVVSRYSASADGNSNYVDYWSAPIQMTRSDARLDRATLSSDGKLNVSGWHAADQTIGKNYHYLILFDETTGKQVGAVKAANSVRNDVAAVYPGIYNEKNSGFSGSFNLTGINLTHKLSIVSRYSTSSSGNGNAGKYVDFWLSAPAFNTVNKASLDNFSFNGGTSINVSGWNATNQALGKNYHYIILFDKTTGKQVGSFLASSLIRNDVAKVNSGILNSGKSGFSGSFSFNSSLIGHDLVVVSRYSTSSSGNGSNGNYVDYWFGEKTFSGNQGNVETVKKTNSGLNISGWQVSDASVYEPYRFMIVFDATTGKELARVRVTTNVVRNDVGSYLPDIYNSDKGGFSVTFKKLQIPSGHKIQIVSRYSNSQTGEGKYTDFWSKIYTI